ATSTPPIFMSGLLVSTCRTLLLNSLSAAGAPAGAGPGVTVLRNSSPCFGACACSGAGADFRSLACGAGPLSQAARVAAASAAAETYTYTKRLMSFSLVGNEDCRTPVMRHCEVRAMPGSHRVESRSCRTMMWQAWKICRRRATAVAFFAACIFPWTAASANSDPLVGVVSEPGGAGVGAAWRMERSPYRGAGTRYDFVPIYVYEGQHAYLHAYRIGLKLERSGKHRFDVFLSHRFEGFPYDRIPASIAGMAERQPGADIGASYEYRSDWGALYAELLHDFIDTSRGNELRLGYRYDWKSGGLTIRPQLQLALRDARLNNYYYGVRPGEATAERPAYDPGAGANLQFGLYGAYPLSERWRLLAGVSATRWSKGVRGSPIVSDNGERALMLGLMYDFSPEHKPWPERKPLLVRAYAGRATECDV